MDLMVIIAPIIAPFATAIIITMVALQHKRKVLELKNDTNIDVIELSKKIDQLTTKVDELTNELQREKKM